MSALRDALRRFDLECRRPPVHTTTRQAQSIYLASASPGLGHRGVIIGKELWSGQGYIYDPFLLYGDTLTGPNALIVGDVGSGKSSLTKSYLLRQLRFGRQAAVLDSKNQGGEGEYADLCRALGVSPIRLVPGGRGGVRFNPLDPVIAYDRQLGLLRTVCEVTLSRRLTEREGAALKVAHAALASYEGQPTVRDLVRSLFHPSDEAAQAYRTTAEALLEDGRDIALGLDRLIDGDLAGMFDGPTTSDIDLDSPLIVFDLSALDRNTVALPILMAVIGLWLEHTWLRPDGRKRIFVVEEGWHVIGNEFIAALFQSMWKLARGLGLQNIAVVHHLSDVDDSGAAVALLKEAQTRIVYRQDPKEAEHCAKVLGLPRWAAHEIPRLARGCAVWVVQNNVQIVQHITSDYEREVCFTDTAMTEPRPVEDVADG